MTSAGSILRLLTLLMLFFAIVPGMDNRETASKAIELLRRQRVRQGEIACALDFLIAQTMELAKGPPGALSQAANQITRQAFELRRIANAVPRFVIEDLLEDSIARLEAAIGR